jgi:hypothetical protein
MKKIFYTGLIGILLFEIANVFFIMPFPGSQRINSIEIAYFLYKWRWIFRSIFLLLILYGLFRTVWIRLWIPLVSLIVVLVAIYFLNFKMAADHMFYQPKNLMFADAASNKVDTQRLVIGVIVNGEAKAYPIRFLGYHHQVQDVIGGKAVLVTYCTVCRTGRVFEPVVDGKHERFRLVGMDHFNAMLEDVTTKSWWRQATGEAIAGKLKGYKLPEVTSSQTSLAEWFRLYPHTSVMQADSSYISMYDTTLKYENGTSRSSLTGTDSLSWKDKSWVIGVRAGNESKAYDWNALTKERIIYDNIGELPVMLVLADDNKSFFAFEAPYKDARITMHHDTLSIGAYAYTLDGKGINTSSSLKRLFASQEFWHSWRTFNPNTLSDK